MALSGVVVPPTAHQPPPSTGAINMAVDLPEPGDIKQKGVLESDFKSNGSPKAMERQLVVSSDAIKAEPMEVDGPKEELNGKSGVTNGAERVESVPGSSSSEGNNSSPTVDEEKAQLIEQQKTNLMENEHNADSRCSTGSNDDMWRPW